MKNGMPKFKAILAIILLVDFVIVISTGIMMYVNVGPTKIEHLHAIAGFLMGALVTIHVVINFRLLIGEITGKVEIRVKKN